MVTEAAASRTSLRRTAAAYVALTKPRIIELLLVTTVPTMIVAAKGIPPIWLIGAMNWCLKQLGQSGQPSPEPVRRTAAPVAMMRNIAAKLTSASLLKARGEIATPRSYRGSVWCPVGSVGCHRW